MSENLEPIAFAEKKIFPKNQRGGQIDPLPVQIVEKDVYLIYF